MKLDTLILGGMATSMCTWSGIRCPSIISTPLYSQSFLSISPMSFLTWLYMTFLLYFGVNTMWYLHIHFVCDRLYALCAIFGTPPFPYGDAA